MPASIGVNLRVTGHCKQGGRKYMEDYFSVAYQQTEDEKDLEYAFFGIFDGHGGSEAATFAKEHLMESIVRQRQFWSDRDDDVLKAIREGFIATHLAMWKEQEKWPKTASGLPSTAGTTASVAFIRRGKIFTGHVGDSGIILGFQSPGSSTWEARRLTKDHKPESRAELMRIEQSGGKVVSKSGVPRVVWYRPQIGHKGPITRSTPFDEIPFLAVARSLGDLWSYNSANNEFVVSPEPDTNVVPIDTDTFRCLIFGTDGLWNMISPSSAVSLVQSSEQHNALSLLSTKSSWVNPSMNLVERALERWANTRMRADNTSVVTLMLDPPGPPRAQVLRSQMTRAERGDRERGYPETGLRIVTRYRDDERRDGCGSSTEARYTEEYLDKLHQELYGSLIEKNMVDSSDVMEVVSTEAIAPEVTETPTEKPPNVPEKEKIPERVPEKGERVSERISERISERLVEKSMETSPEVASTSKGVETIQINVVSSSSDSDNTPKKGVGRSKRTLEGEKYSGGIYESTRARSSKKEKQISEDELRIRRSRSLGPRDLAQENLTPPRTRSRVSAPVQAPPKKLRGRPPKRERNESDEENVIIPPKLKRSRSLGPRDLSGIVSDRRNLRERNNIDLTKPKTRGSSASDLRVATRNRARRSVK